MKSGDFASRSKAKAKPQRGDSAGSSTRTIPIGERTWTDVEPGEYSISDYEVSKKLIRLLRHGSLPRDDDGWRIKDHLQNHFLYCQRAINLHSIINSGLIPGGQNLSNRRTVFFLLVDPMDKNHEDPDTIDFEAPRLEQNMHKAWKKHQNTVYWVDISLALKKGLKFYQTRSNAIILHETLPAYCIPKVFRMETGEVIYEKVHASPRPPPKISLKHDWMKELGSEVARQPEGQVQQSKSSQPSQPNPNPDHDRTGKPVVCRDENHEQPTVVCSEQTTHPRFSREGQNLIVEEETNHDRTEKPVVCRDANHERSMSNEVDIDFRIFGLPHSVETSWEISCS